MPSQEQKDRKVGHTIRFESWMHELITDIADRSYRSFAAQVIYIVEEWLREQGYLPENEDEQEE